MAEKYVFTMHHEDGTIVSLEGNKIRIDDILEDFKTFLIGCTFSAELVDEIWRGPEPETYHGN